jgi:hypothetical protein
MIKYILPLLLCVSSAFAQDINALDPTKVYDTPNLTTFNQNGSQTTTPWQNVGQWGGQITCWAPGQPGYCGPNPYVNAFGNGSINFSYGLTDLYQVVTIANALPKSGTGLRINGYNFGFTAKNGNGWDNGQQDYLSAYVNFYGSDGKQLRSDYYDLNSVFNWTNFNFSKTFDTPYASKELGTVRYGFVGGDSNFWAGPYGPEVTNVSFSLKYSVDPCYINVLSSPTCPGYMEELNKLTAVTTIEKETTVTTAQPIVETPTVAVATPQATTSFELLPPKNEKTESKTTETPSLSFALSLIQSNRAREQRIEMAAVAQANEAAQTAVSQAEKTAMEVSSTSIAQSLDIARDSVKSDVRETKTNINSSLSLLPSSGPFVTQANSNIVQQSQLLSNQLSLPINSFNQQQMNTNNSNTNTVSGLYNRPEINIPVSPIVQEIAQPLEMKLPSNTNNINTQQVEQLNNNMSLFARRGDPLSDYIEQNNVLVAMTQTETKSTTVKTNVQDNDLAGGVRIERMAVTPVGFSVYSMMLRDAAFYQPKEIYKNVVIRDNVRTMYFIEKGNTDTYNKMLDQQYK